MPKTLGSETLGSGTLGGASLPLPRPLRGVFPFFQKGDVVKRDGTVLVEELPMTIYDGSQFASFAGEAHDYTAYLPYRALEFIGDSSGNLRIVSEGTTYNVSTVVRHRFVRYLEVGLRRQLDG